MSQYFIETDIFFKIQISLALKMYFNQFKAHTHTHTQIHNWLLYNLQSARESEKKEGEHCVWKIKNNQET